MPVKREERTMETHDAVEDDATRIAELTGAPTSVTRELVHDRTTKVTTRASSDETEEGDGDGNEDEDNGERKPGDDGDLLGVVSFDARREAVHVTQLAGTTAAVSRLLNEPIRFAEREDMAVEAVLEADESDCHEAVREAGFERAGSGPRFEGRETVVFRFET
jgi:hypothetical protein